MVDLLGLMEHAATGNSTPTTTAANAAGSAAHQPGSADGVDAGARAGAGASGAPSGGRAAVPFAQQGGPWEFNLRDLLRWCKLAEEAAAGQLPPQGAATQPTPSLGKGDAMDVDGGLPQQAGGSGALALPSNAVALDAAVEAAVLHYAQMLFAHRLRTRADRQQFQALLLQAWGARAKGAGAPSQAVAVAAAGGNAGVQQDGVKASGTFPAASSLTRWDTPALPEVEGLSWEQVPSVLVSPEALVVGRARLRRGGPGAAHSLLASDGVEQVGGVKDKRQVGGGIRA